MKKTQVKLFDGHVWFQRHASLEFLQGKGLIAGPDRYFRGKLSATDIYSSVRSSRDGLWPLVMHRLRPKDNCVTGSYMNHDVSARPLAKGATLHLRSTRKMLKTQQCLD